MTELKYTLDHKPVDQTIEIISDKTQVEPIIVTIDIVGIVRHITEIENENLRLTKELAAMHFRMPNSTSS